MLLSTAGRPFSHPRCVKGRGCSPGLAPGHSFQRAPWKGLGKMGEGLEARRGFPKPRALTAWPMLSCLAFLPEAAEVCGLHDAGVPEKGKDASKPVPPALPPSHEDHPPVRSLTPAGRGRCVSMVGLTLERAPLLKSLLVGPPGL